jgi:1-acyl-sn-glycerol-3-phosphate acyltransferase
MLKLKAFRNAIRPEIGKVSTQLGLLFRHDFTYYTAGVAVLIILVKRYLRNSNKEEAIHSFISETTKEEIESSKSTASPINKVPEKEVQTKKQKSFKRAKSVGFSLHKFTPLRSSLLVNSNIDRTKFNTSSVKRSRSREVLHTLLKRPNSKISLCTDCMTRVSSHNSITMLSGKGDHVNRNGKSNTGGSETHDLQCIVCETERVSWSFYVKRAFYITTAVLFSYVLYLRFVASRETAFNHFSTMVRGLAILFRYKVIGDDAIPRNGPAIVTVYHGYIPLDMYFFQEYALRCIRKDTMVMVADFVFQIPLIGYIIELGGGVRANPAAALEHLSKGGLLIVAPGGVREAMTPTIMDYSIFWGKRIGFAKIAKEANAIIIPMFTKNIREVFLVLGGDNFIVKWLYKKTKLPFTFFVGPFLLPLTTMFGPSIGPFRGTSTSFETISKASQASLQLLMSRLS